MDHRAAVLGGPQRPQRGVLGRGPAVLERRGGGLGDDDLRTVAHQSAAHVGERRLEADQRTDPQPPRPVRQGHHHLAVAAQPVLARRLAHGRRPPQQGAGRDVLAERDQTHLVVAVPGRPVGAHQHRRLEDPRPPRAVRLPGVHIDQQIRADPAGQLRQPPGGLRALPRTRTDTALAPHHQVHAPALQRTGQLLAPVEAARDASRSLHDARLHDGDPDRAGVRGPGRPGRHRRDGQGTHHQQDTGGRTGRAVGDQQCRTGVHREHQQTHQPHPAHGGDPQGGGDLPLTRAEQSPGSAQPFPGPDQLDHQPPGGHDDHGGDGTRRGRSPAEQPGHQQPPGSPEQPQQGGQQHDEDVEARHQPVVHRDDEPDAADPAVQRGPAGRGRRADQQQPGDQRHVGEPPESGRGKGERGQRPGEQCRRAPGPGGRERPRAGRAPAAGRLPVPGAAVPAAALAGRAFAGSAFSRRALARCAFVRRAFVGRTGRVPADRETPAPDSHAVPSSVVRGRAVAVTASTRGYPVWRR